MNPPSDGRSRPDRVPEATPERVHGIDYLRAVMSVCVVVWHMGGSGRSLIFSPQRFAEHVFEFSDLVNFHLLLVAVPVFILISNFLFARRQPDATRGLQRLKRYFLLFTFWTFAYIVFEGGVGAVAAMLPASPAELPLFFLKGFNTIYYFFVCLMFTTVLTYWASRRSTAVLSILTVATSAVLVAMPIMAETLNLFSLSAFWNPLNFLPYPFAAVLMARMESRLAHGRAMMFALLAAASCLFAIIEWKIYPGPFFLKGQHYAMPAYTRLSLLFEACALLLAALSPIISPNRLVAFMARNSLPLYCLHPFFIRPVTGGLSGAALEALDAGQLSVYIAMVIGLSYLAPFILKYFVRKELIS